MKREEVLRDAAERRLKVVRLLRKNGEATNEELQAVYGEMLMSTQHMGLLKRAVKQGGVQHPERYSPKKLKELLDGDARAEKLRKKHIAKHGSVRTLHAVPSAVDKLAGLKRFLDETVLPGMMAYTVGSDVQTVVITVTTDPAGNPTLSRKIGRAVTEWDEHTLDTRVEADNG